MRIWGYGLGFRTGLGIWDEALGNWELRGLGFMGLGLSSGVALGISGPSGFGRVEPHMNVERLPPTTCPHCFAWNDNCWNYCGPVVSVLIAYAVETLQSASLALQCLHWLS